ncbi:transposase [Methylobacterium sp. NPDC080182]|uniref:transposase n=1 Tax=Methylobacterium sp. NPDC080182 TaxID=3390590 RepID=UPI003CFF727B
MTRERDQALSGIGNAKFRAQMMAADTENIEKQVRQRARLMQSRRILPARSPPGLRRRRGANLSARPASAAASSSWRRAASMKPRCIRSQRRLLTPRSLEEYDALVAARARETSSAFAVDRRRRAGIEGTLSRGVRTTGLRRSRYLSLARTHLQHLLTATATAINLGRLAA